MKMRSRKAKNMFTSQCTPVPPRICITHYGSIFDPPAASIFKHSEKKSFFLLSNPSLIQKLVLNGDIHGIYKSRFFKIIKSFFISTEMLTSSNDMLGISSPLSTTSVRQQWELIQLAAS